MHGRPFASTTESVPVGTRHGIRLCRKGARPRARAHPPARAQPPAVEGPPRRPRRPLLGSHRRSSRREGSSSHHGITSLRRSRLPLGGAAVEAVPVTVRNTCPMRRQSGGTGKVSPISAAGAARRSSRRRPDRSRRGGASPAPQYRVSGRVAQSGDANPLGSSVALLRGIRLRGPSAGSQPIAPVPREWSSGIRARLRSPLRLHVTGNLLSGTPLRARSRLPRAVGALG